MSNNSSGKGRGYVKLIEELYTEKLGRPVKINEVMRYLYVEKQMTMHQIAAELHMSTGTTHKLLHEAGIAARVMKWL